MSLLQLIVVYSKYRRIVVLKSFTLHETVTKVENLIPQLCPIIEHSTVHSVDDPRIFLCEIFALQKCFPFVLIHGRLKNRILELTIRPFLGPLETMF